MKIRTQFLLTLVLFSAFVLVVAGSFIFASAELNKAGQQEIRSNDVAQGATELGYLADDYLLNREAQQKARWETRFDQVANGLEQINTSNPETATLVADIKINLNSLQMVFKDVSSTIESNPSFDPATRLNFIQVSWSRLQVPTQAIVSDATRLPAFFENQADDIQRRELFLVIGILGLVIVYFVSNYFLVNRRTLNSIAQLQTGARFVGSGNLDYAIPTKYDDEISDLARTFNKMTASLRSITISRSDLEKEMIKRVEAEEELQIANDELRISNQNLQENAQKLEEEMHARSASEERFRRLFEEAPYAVALSSVPDGRYADVNEAFAMMTGYSKQEIIGKNSSELNIFRNDLNRARAVQELQAEGSVKGEEAVIYNKSGEKLFVTSNIEKVSFDGQDFWLNMSLDITDRKKAEIQVQTTLERFYLMFGGMYAGVLILTEDGRVEFANQAFCDMFLLKEKPENLRGTSAENFLGMIKHAYKYPDQALQRINEIVKRMEPISGEQLEYSNGRTAIRDFTPLTVAGKVSGRMWIHTDITKLKRVEKELATSNQKNSEILTSITDDFYVLDRDWNFTYANKTFTGKIGKEPSDFIGNSIWKMFPGHIGTVLEENFRAAMDKRETRRFEFSGKYTRAWYRMSAFPSFEGITVLGEDITEFKKAEEELRESYEELERINRAAVGRELRMVELKKEINRFYEATGQPPRFILDTDEDK